MTSPSSIKVFKPVNPNPLLSAKLNTHVQAYPKGYTESIEVPWKFPDKVRSLIFSDQMKP